MAVDRSLLQTLLQLKHPWSVLEYEMDPARRRLDIWVGTTAAASWFGIVRRGHDTSSEQVWRHDNIGMFSTFIHFNVTREAEIPVAPWSNLAGFPFSRSVTQRARALIADDASIKSIVLALGMTPEEVWKLRHVTAPSDATGAQHAQKRPAAAPASAHSAATPTPPAAPGGVPDAEDPVWQRLVDGMNIDIRVLSLKLLLARVRSQMQGITDPDISLLHLSELHRYFVRHERILGHEISQLRGH